MNFNLNFEKLNFTTNWATLTAIAALLIFSVTLFVQNKSLNDTNTKLLKENKSLIDHVNNIDSTLLIMNQWMKYRDETIQALAKYPPSRIENDMLKMEYNITKEIRIRHGMSTESFSDFKRQNQQIEVESPTNQ